MESSPIQKKANKQDITFVTKDAMKFKVDIRFANLSFLIRSILEDSSLEEEIPLDMDRSMLEKILAYADLHDFSPPKIQKPIKSADLRSNLCE